MEVLRYVAIDDNPAKNPAGAATTSGLFVPKVPRRRQLASLSKNHNHTEIKKYHDGDEIMITYII